MNTQPEHIIGISQFLEGGLLEEVFRRARIMEEGMKKGTVPPVLRGKVLAALFYEPSTRTRFSFETAMFRLGGEVISSESAAHFSSAAKGETIPDTVRIVGGYADVIVMRHPVEGSAAEAAKYSPVPVVNAGDGAGEHPTQALLDAYTIYKEKGTMDNLTVGLIGDLLYGRTIHSLLVLLAAHQNVRICLISPSQLQLPPKYKEKLTVAGVAFEEHAELDKVIGDLDVLYVTRVQKERFDSEEEYERLKKIYVIDEGTLGKMKKDAIIMHPLPRVGEVSPAIDGDPRAAYFRQAKNGLYVRMALLTMVLGAEV